MRMKWMVLVALTLITLLTLVTPVSAEGMVVIPGPIVHIIHLIQ